MSTRTPYPPRAALALAAIGALVALIVPSLAGARTTTAELRVLTPTKVLDPGTTYFVDDSVTVPTRPQADCFGPPGGSGAEYSYEKPVALSLLASAGRATKGVRPLSLTDQFGFGLAICGIGGFEAGPGEFWYLKSNHEEASVGADQLTVRNGDQILFYLAADNFPEPNPGELELFAPARAKPGEPFTVRVLRHACITDQTTYEVSCGALPAAGATIAGAEGETTIAADGTAQVTLRSDSKLLATRGSDIPSQALAVCVDARLGACPAKRGKRIVGSPRGDRIKGTKGADAVRARGGADTVDLRKGGGDRVDCGRGKDTVLLARGERAKIARDCERIRRR